jgi:hypothetical protein
MPHRLLRALLDLPLRATSRLAFFTAIVLISALGQAQPRGGTTGPQSRSVTTGKARMTNTPELSLKVTRLGDSLELRYSVTNHLAEPILVFDKLRERNEDVLDPEQIYRYVVGSTLRLLLGPAPLPRGRNVFSRNVPHVTRVGAYKDLRSTIKLALPLKEYSAYFAGHDASSVQVAVRDVELLVSYVPAAGIDVAPSAAGAEILRVASPGAWGAAQTIRSNVVALPLDVLVTQVSHFSRPVLPSDPP